MLPSTTDAIAGLSLNRNRPLLIVDADEVLVHFAAHFDVWLYEEGYVLRLTEYRLDAAIRDAKSDQVVSPAVTTSLINRFIDEQTRHQPMIEGAANGLETLAEEMEIVVLTNAPERAAEARRENLAGHGIPYPVITNSGSKSLAITALEQKTDAAVLFIDDSPFHIGETARLNPFVTRLHFSGCDLVRGVMPTVREAHHAPQDWQQIVEILNTIVADASE